MSRWHFIQFSEKLFGHNSHLYKSQTNIAIRTWAYCISKLVSGVLFSIMEVHFRDSKFFLTFRAFWHIDKPQLRYLLIHKLTYGIYALGKVNTTPSRNSNCGKSFKLHLISIRYCLLTSFKSSRLHNWRALFCARIKSNWTMDWKSIIGVPWTPLYACSNPLESLYCELELVDPIYPQGSNPTGPGWAVIIHYSARAYLFYNRIST